MGSYAVYSDVPTLCRRGRRRRDRSGELTQDVEIAEFLREAGFDTPEASGRARAVLEAAGLTRAGKRAMAAAKLSRARALLEDTLVRVCGTRCLAADRRQPWPAREAVTVTKAACEVCGGSNNVQAALEASAVLRRRGISRVLVVGGSPGVWDGLRRAFDGSGVELRMVDGTQRSHSDRDAEGNKRWAQVIVIWGASELRHAVSVHYQQDVPDDVRVITVARRGVAAVCEALVESYR